MQTTIMVFNLRVLTLYCWIAPLRNYTLQMSDVESGGATVFNHLGNAVFPSKYDALFWYNLRRFLFFINFLK